MTHINNAVHEEGGIEHFNIKCLVTKEIYEEMKWSFVPKTTIVFYISMALGLFWLGINFSSYIISAILYVTGLSFIVTLFRLPSQTINIIMARLKESYGTDEMHFTLLFADERINIYNLVSGATSSLEYECIVKFVSSQNAYMLMSRASQFIIVNKTALSDEQKGDEFARFLKGKCKNIKW